MSAASGLSSALLLKPLEVVGKAPKLGRRVQVDVSPPFFVGERFGLLFVKGDLLIDKRQVRGYYFHVA